MKNDKNDYLHVRKVFFFINIKPNDYPYEIVFWSSTKIFMQN